MVSKGHALSRDALVRTLTAYSGITTADGAVDGTTLVDSNLIGRNDFISEKTILIMSDDAKDEDKGATAFDNSDGKITLQGTGFRSQIKAGTIFRVLNISTVEMDVANIKTAVDGIKTQTDKIAGKMLFSIDFWSDPVEEKAVTAAQVTAAVGAAVVVADLPATATIVRAIVMMKFRMVENTNAAENSLDCTAAQPIQVDDSGNTGWVDAINFVDEQFKIAAETREGGDVLIGDNDVAARVDGNDTYDFQWLNAKAHLANIQFNDIQMGIRIWYSI